MIGWSQSEDDSTQRAQIQTDAIHHSRHSTNESERKKVPQKSSEMEFPDPKDWIPHLHPRLPAACHRPGHTQALVTVKKTIEYVGTL